MDTINESPKKNVERPKTLITEIVKELERGTVDSEIPKVINELSTLIPDEATNT